MNESVFLVVGLGNKGEEYNKTPHNIGFEVIDELIERQRATLLKTKKYVFELYKGDLDGYTIYMLKPLTFMNSSGLAVKAAMKLLSIPLAKILIIHDDFNLTLGTLRFRSSGTSGGHKGMQSIIDQLKTNEIARVKIGTGPLKQSSKKEFVLKKWDSNTLLIVQEVIKEAVNFIPHLLLDPRTPKTITVPSLNAKK